MTRNFHCSQPETKDDIYVNMQTCRPKPQRCTESSMSDNKKTGKVISAFGLLLLLGALSALCIVGLLYHYKAVSYEILRKKYENVTATMMQEHKGKEKDMQSQELISACGDNQTCKHCKEGWKSLGLKCYYFSNKKLNWTQSRDYCVEKGGHLVIITNQIEQDFVSSQAGETHWIGLNDLETEGKWMWVNNQPLTETNVTLWYISPEGVSEPDNWNKEDASGENCAALGHEYAPYHTNKWFDASCRKLKLFICEK